MSRRRRGHVNTVCSLTHHPSCHPAVSQAVHAQVDTLTHLQCSIGFHKPYLQLIERLKSVMPDPSLDSFFFWNSGSEAIEAAIKIARKATGRPNVISMNGGYHGRTYGSGALSRSKNIYTVGAGALMPGSHATPFPYWHSMSLPITTSEDELVRIAIAQLDLLFRTQTAHKDTAAIFIEPVIGEGGYVPTPHAFLRHLRNLCDEHGILLIADEVQSGFGRTGKMFAIEHSAVRPDVLVFAKGVANGYPLSGVVAPRKVMETLDTGVLGGTYAGNAVACAAATAVVDVFNSQDVLGNVEARGKQLHDGLEKIAQTEAGKKLIVERRGQNVSAPFPQTKPPLLTRPAHGRHRVPLGRPTHPPRPARRDDRPILHRAPRAGEVPRRRPAPPHHVDVRGHPLHPLADRYRGAGGQGARGVRQGCC